MDENRWYKQRTVQALFPDCLKTVFQNVVKDYTKVSEIRIRQNGPICVSVGKDMVYLNKEGKYIHDITKAVVLSGRNFETLLHHICRHSVYAYEEEIKSGYITVEGGHRIGIVGQTVWDGKEIKAVKHFNALNIRIAHEIKGAADTVLPFLIEDNELKSTLIVSMPGCGKTTLLRDLVRKISNGTREMKGKNVCIIDERSELASSYLGIAQNDVGLHTDILDSCPKATGMLWVLRSMAPEVIAVDELGGERDYLAVRQAFYLGCRVLATVHGRDDETIKMNENLKKLIGKGGFQRILFLGEREQPGKIHKIYNEKGMEINLG